MALAGIWHTDFSEESKSLLTQKTWVERMVAKHLSDMGAAETSRITTRVSARTETRGLLISMLSLKLLRESDSACDEV